MIAAMRLILSLSAVAVIYIDPSEPDRFVAVTYAALVVYAVYSTVLYLFAVPNGRLQEWISPWGHWVDICWYTVLIGLSNGTSSVFFFFYFFSILVASFRWGFASGLRVTTAGVVAFTLVGYATAGTDPDFALNRFLLRPIYMLVLGYMIAYWGGREILLKRRLALLGAVTSLSNLRFGVDQTVNSIMERIRAFYDADRCIQITADPAAGIYRMRHATASRPHAASREQVVPAELASMLLALPSGCAVVYNRRPWAGLRRLPGYFAWDVGRDEPAMDTAELSEGIAAYLDAESFISVPIRHYTEAIGRFFLTSQRPAFAESDVEFLFQVVEQITPVIENIRLVDRLAIDAADQERRRIARDLHDSVIQPYIGFGMGLSALRQKAARGDVDIAEDIGKLMEMAEYAIGDLRQYTRRLRDNADGDEGLVPAVRRFAGRFAEMTGVSVDVVADADVHVSDRLAAEAFQFIAEGLSNVRRHTRARSAVVSINYAGEALTLRIENEIGGGPPPAPFFPRSIQERALTLGGDMIVREDAGGRTAVEVRIPL
jgi:signal transduction histidine kinase